MSSQKAGLRYENKLANHVHEDTTDEVRVYPIGYSGNHAMPAPDILFTTGEKILGVEVKRSTISTGDYSYILHSDDFEQMCALENENTDVGFAVKFTRRELYVLPDVSVPDDPSEYADRLAEEVYDCFEPHVTDSGNLRLTKPETDEWPSATRGMDDSIVMANYFDLPKRFGL